MPEPKRLVGYADALTVPAGGRITFHVSAPGSYDAALVRLLHGDTNPDGPGPLEAAVAAPFAGRHEGREQPIELGSHGIGGGEPIDLLQTVTWAVWVHPTLAGDRWRGLLTRGGVCGLFLAPGGDAAFRAGSGVVRTGRPLRRRSWTLVSAVADLRTGAVSVHQRPAGPFAALDGDADASGTVPAAAGVEPVPVLLGHGFDGKLDRPTLFAGALDPAAVAGRLAGPGTAASAGPDLLAAWDLGADHASVHVPDRSGRGGDLELVNLPTRAVTSHEWTGDAGGHAAVHFHTDDLEDAGWAAAFAFDVPDDLESGVYAARLDGGGETDHVPFLVTPRRPAADVAVVLPTFTYLAYADERITPDFEALTESPEDAYVTATGMLSQYNRHADGSGVVHASRLRPLMNLRPGYRYWLTGHPHGLGADLHLLHWLRGRGTAVDVYGDEDLHERGAELLAPYRVVLTGSHPEYVTRAELHALRAHVDAGGRLMHLGGNGFCMVTGVHPERPHATEIRRTSSHAGLWEGDPGELRLATTGEEGGHWTFRHERPRGLVGVDIVGMGFRSARPYERTDASRDPEVAWVFEGVGDGPIGDFGLVMGGAAGYEVDGADLRRGTPEHAVVLATARGFGEDYVATSADEDVRADMVLLRTAAGGAVFSVGSIAWCGALQHAGGDNPVARITANVLERFRAP